MGKNLIEQALEIFADYCEKEYGGNKSAMSVAFGMNHKTGMLGKWFNGTRVPSLSSLSPLLERIGVNLTSENAAHNPPETYNKNKDFNGDLNNAIVGRVIWAWMDVRDK